VPTYSANLVVGLASWGTSNSPLTSALSKDGDRYQTRIDVCPLTTLQLTNDARQRAVLRELNDWDQVSDTRPLTVVAANPHSPEALERFNSLCDALTLRRQRLKFAACDDDTAIAFAEALRGADIDTVGPGEITVPSTPGSAAELAGAVAAISEDDELSLVLEEVEEITLVAKRLVGEGQRVVKMPIFGRTKNPLGGFILDQDLPNFILVNDAMSVYQAVQGIKRLGFGASEVTWVGTKPALKEMALRDAPDSSWLDVPDLRHRTILDRVSRHVA